MASRLPASCILWPAGSRPWCRASQVRDNSERIQHSTWWCDATYHKFCRRPPRQPPVRRARAGRPGRLPQAGDGHRALVRCRREQWLQAHDKGASCYIAVNVVQHCSLEFTFAVVPFDPSPVYLRFWDVGRIWQGMRKTRFHGFHYRFLLYYCPQDLAYQFRWKVPRHH